MENLDVLVLRSLRDWRIQGLRAMLVTVVRTWGSSPRPVGSIMALCENGAVVGSVSGGCVEDDLIDRHTKTSHSRMGGIPQGKPSLIKYGVSASEAHRFGLPCGGTLELLLEYDPDAQLLDTLVQGLEGGHLMQRRLSLQSGSVSQSAIAIPSTPASLSLSADELVNTFGPEYRMLLIGAGQLSEYLATMALFSGFAVTVCDPREEYRGSWQIPGAVLSAAMPDDLIETFKPDSRSCVVALTHDPKLDDLALLAALASNAFYVGAIGSRRNAQARRERLIAHFGQTEQSLARLRSPVGIYIGSKTPPEIAVSVMAEVLAAKNGVLLPQGVAVGPAKEGLLSPPTPSAPAPGPAAGPR